MGLTGPIGPTGANGADGVVPSGTIISLLQGTPAPAGYTLIGSSTQTIDEPNGGKKNVKVTLDLYRKN